MPFVTLADGTLHYEVRPAQDGAPTVVYSNSLGTDLRIWDGVLAAMPPEFGALRYDKRGHGLSDLTATPGDLDAHVRDVAALMDHVGLGRAVICGLSVGGVIAQRLAALEPSRVLGLVLSNTAAKVGSPQDWNARIEKVREGGLQAISDAVMARWFAQSFHRDQPATLAGMTNMLVRQRAESYIAICRMLRDTDLTEAAGTLTVPALCIAGEFDGATPPDLVRATAERIEGAEFALIDGVGHIPCVEAPGEVAARIAEFVRDRVSVRADG